jgi:ankyrin repeat protein
MVDRNGRRALHFLAMRPFYDETRKIAHLLLKASAEDAPDRFGHTAVDWAKRYGRDELAELLEARPQVRR